MNVERVDFVNIATRDAERARAWYRDVFGLAEDPNNADELTAGQVTLTFWEPEKEGIEFKPNIAGFALRVDDIEAAKAELEEKGVAIVGEGDTGVCNMVVCIDPDENAVILHRRYKAYE
jgi:catechol 2,3-dioxygenase-like lactoylglutathione lyase family enzyme